MNLLGWLFNGVGKVIVAATRVLITATSWAVTHPVASMAIGGAAIVGSLFCAPGSWSHDVLGYVGWWMLTAGALGWAAGVISRGANLFAKIPFPGYQPVLTY